VQQLRTRIEKHPYDGKPLIPSYLILTALAGITDALKTERAALEEQLRVLLRSIETIRTELTRASEDTKLKIDSPDTPQSVKDLLPEKTSRLQQALDEIGREEKSVRDTSDNVTRTAAETIRTIDELLAAEKNTSIFDAVRADES
jgi:vacuolar-type H+-ATPase subunit D/Vma8